MYQPETWFERLLKEEVLAQSHTTLAKTWLQNYLVYEVSLALDKPKEVEEWFDMARGAQQSWGEENKEPFFTGLDTEFVNSRLATIQIAIPKGPSLTSGHVLVLSLTKAKTLPACLVDWLSDASVPKMCMDPTQDVKLLARWMPSDKPPRGIFNVADMAPASWCLSPTCGMERLANRVLSVSLKRSRQVLLSDWLAWPLNRDQLEHAALDAILACEMAHCLGQKRPARNEHKDDGQDGANMVLYKQLSDANKLEKVRTSPYRLVTCFAVTKGKYYVFVGGQQIGGPFDTVDQALATCARLLAQAKREGKAPLIICAGSPPQMAMIYQANCVKN